jgi:hypothetical protein
MRENKAAFEKHFGDITQTQDVSQPPHDREEDDIWREFQGVKGSASSFIEETSAMWTEERCVARLGFLYSFSG